MCSYNCYSPATMDQIAPNPLAGLKWLVCPIIYNAEEDHTTNENFSYSFVINKIPRKQKNCRQLKTTYDNDIDGIKIWRKNLPKMWVILKMPLVCFLFSSELNHVQLCSDQLFEISPTITECHAQIRTWPEPLKNERGRTET